MLSFTLTRAGAQAVQKRTSLVLEGRGLSHVTGGAELVDLCPQLKEARNTLSQWRDVSRIIVCPVVFFNLSLPG